MSEVQITNLDVQCAELGRRLANIRDDKNKPIEEKVFNEALAVLEEQGPYAMFLYLQARHGNVASKVNDKALEFLQSIFRDQLEDKTTILDAIKTLSEGENLDNLLFARDLLRTALSYARYHLKAKGGGAS